MFSAQPTYTPPASCVNQQKTLISQLANTPNMNASPNAQDGPQQTLQVKSIFDLFLFQFLITF